MTPFRRIGVLAHPTRPQTAPVAAAMSDTLRARGLETWLLTEWTPDEVTQRLDATDLVIAIGGDGAMLRAARVCAPFGMAIFGVNMGHLGFLTEIDGRGEWDASIDLLQAGRYWIEQRMMLSVTAYHDTTLVSSGEALNEAIIGRGSVTRMIHLDVYIDGMWTTTYNADALIVATATGSTAYALAAGGPILPPELRNILVLPVAPHLTLDRPIILPEGAMVEVIVGPEMQTDSVLAVDGELLADLQAGDRVCIQASPNVGRFVRLREPRYFYRSLLDRLEPRAPVPPAPERREL